MKRIARLLIVCCLLFATGCAELATTVKIMNTALIELFRLPIYLMKIPFQLLQSLGPALQAAMRTAANMAPLLLFIDNRVPGEKFYACRSREEMEQKVRTALEGNGSVPLTALLRKEVGSGGAKRFILVDARLLQAPGIREGLLDLLASHGEDVRCLRVHAGTVLSRPENFLAVCGQMRERGDILFALTAFNAALASLTRITPQELPPDPADSALVLEWDRLLDKVGNDLGRKG